jgi:hypothetical protein
MNVKVRVRGQWFAHYYSNEMARRVETFHKVPTWHGQRSNPLISIRHSKSSDWVRLWFAWPSTKVTLIDSGPCHSVAQHYSTTNYWLPLIPFYTARTFYSCRLHTLWTFQSTSSTRYKLCETQPDRFHIRRSKLFSFVRTCLAQLFVKFYKLLSSFALDHRIHFTLRIVIFVFYDRDLSVWLSSIYICLFDY